MGWSNTKNFDALSYACCDEILRRAAIDAPEVESTIESPSKSVEIPKGKGPSHGSVVYTIPALNVVARAKEAEAKETGAAKAKAPAERVTVSAAAEEVAAGDRQVGEAPGAVLRGAPAGRRDQGGQPRGDQGGQPRGDQGG